MPAYNEEQYIGSMVLQSRKYADDILVVDDGSIDRTAEIAKLAGATVIQHPIQKGKGAVVQSILLEAKKRAPDILVLLDADYQHNPDEIPNLLKFVREGYDLVIGSRVLQVEKTPRYRNIGRKILLYSTRILSGQRVSDSESGFRALSSKAISNLSLRENGFAIESEMIACAKDKHLKIIEVPISNIYTKDGSTLNPVRHGLGVFLRIFVMISERRPLFFFGLGGGIITILGIIAGARVLWVFTTSGGVTVGTILLSVLLLTVGIFSMFTGLILNVLVKRRG